MLTVPSVPSNSRSVVSNEIVLLGVFCLWQLVAWEVGHKSGAAEDEQLIFSCYFYHDLLGNAFTCLLSTSFTHRSFPFLLTALSLFAWSSFLCVGKCSILDGCRIQKVIRDQTIAKKESKIHATIKMSGVSLNRWINEHYFRQIQTSKLAAVLCTTPFCNRRRKRRGASQEQEIHVIRFFRILSHIFVSWPSLTLAILAALLARHNCMQRCMWSMSRN